MSQDRLSMSARYQREAGVTALIAVIFAALLLSVITISFITIMVRDQRAANDDEQSQSAYDSAMAGVEDAKRVIAACQTSGGTSPACTAIERKQCNTVAAAGIAGNPAESEVLVQSTTSPDGGAELNQAYTCVTITMDSTDYVATLTRDTSQIIPLRAKANVSKVRIEWHQASDTTSGAVVPLVADGRCTTDMFSARDLCTANRWGSFPALLRAQAITPGDAVDYAAIERASNSGTVFLYPSRSGLGLGTIGYDFTTAHRYPEDNGEDSWSLNRPETVRCANSDVELVASGYGCRVELTLPQVVKAGSSLSLLRLSALYRSTTVRITPLDAAGNPVEFAAVQPKVDSTGRANDLFRRVEARLTLDDQFAYPEYALDLTGNLCKDFSVTDTGVFPRGTCTP